MADAEAAASTLLEELDNLLRGDVSAPSPELEASRSTNSKARYQLGILERAVAREIYHQPQQVDPAAPAASPTVTIPAAASGNGVDLPTLDGLSVDKAVALINAGIACTVGRQVGHAELTAAGVARCTDRKAILRRLNADASRRCAAEPHLQQQRQPSQAAAKGGADTDSDSGVEDEGGGGGGGSGGGAVSTKTGRPAAQPSQPEPAAAAAAAADARMPSTAALVAMSAEERKAAWKAMEYPDGAEAGAAEAVAEAEAPREEDAVFEEVKPRKKGKKVLTRRGAIKRRPPNPNADRSASLYAAARAAAAAERQAAQADEAELEAARKDLVRAGLWEHITGATGKMRCMPCTRTGTGTGTSTDTSSNPPSPALAPLDVHPAGTALGEAAAGGGGVDVNVAEPPTMDFALVETIDFGSEDTELAPPIKLEDLSRAGRVDTASNDTPEQQQRSYEDVHGPMPTGPVVDADGLAQQVAGRASQIEVLDTGSVTLRSDGSDLDGRVTPTHVTEDDAADGAWTVEAGGRNAKRVNYERPPDASAADREGLGFLMADLGNALGRMRSVTPHHARDACVCRGWVCGGDNWCPLLGPCCLMCRLSSLRDFKNIRAILTGIFVYSHSHSNQRPQEDDEVVLPGDDDGGATPADEVIAPPEDNTDCSVDSNDARAGGAGGASSVGSSEEPAADQLDTPSAYASGAPAMVAPAAPAAASTTAGQAVPPPAAPPTPADNGSAEEERSMLMAAGAAAAVAVGLVYWMRS